MSKISNTLPKQGDALSSTDLNALFTAWTGATSTAMNEDNAANQSVDITNLNLQATSGQAGFILKNMQGHNILNAAGVTLQSEQTVGAPPPFNTISNSTFSFGASGKTIAVNDIIRIYYHVRVGNMTYDTDFPANSNTWNACWAVWLEYASAWTGSPSGWATVPGQGNFATSVVTAGSNTWYGLRLNAMQGTTIIPHSMGAYDVVAGAATRIDTNLQDFNGQYYLKPGAPLTWYGLRLRVGGVFKVFNYGGNNYIVFNSHSTTPVVKAGNAIQYFNGNIAYFQMDGA
jgi:hypothetical protein